MTTIAASTIYWVAVVLGIFPPLLFDTSNNPARSGISRDGPPPTQHRREELSAITN